ncbi:hypothetical protein ACUXQ2_006360 [Cupriavidus metallidurans]|uniref:hypothetical protein n=1 Tax=Cupriavidus sp. HMR-1 TaxID=1249621 RepID=UPI0002A3828C|nr:hypothetical protein [Cupriavidus sp. HMR-1]EKZ99005.1 hypothetical protein D769_12186 [Cupriavidus sp. HMR-1]
MDIQELQKLHSQYAEPPLTIDVQPSGAISMTPGAHALPAPDQPNTSSETRLNFAAFQRKALMVGLLLVLAATAYGIGSWMGSSQKRKPMEIREQAAAPQDRTDVTVSDHQWPAASAVVPAKPADLASAPIVLEPQAPATGVRATAPQEQPAEQRPEVKLPAKKPQVTSPPHPDQQAVPSHQPVKAPTKQQGNEITLF